MNRAKTMIRAFAILCTTFSLCIGLCTPSMAATKLPDGALAGLPDSLSVLDSDGHTADSDSGEYYFYVEDMKERIAYTKDIQITNYRDDAAYDVYLYAYPVSHSGKINLQKDTTAVFKLDGDKLFTGRVDGLSEDGSKDLSEEPLHIGHYVPGESRTLTCKVTWDGSDIDAEADYGSRIVDIDGTHTVQKGNGSIYVEGEVIFRWVFYAVLDEDYVPPKTGLGGIPTWVYLVASAALVLLIFIMILLLARKKRVAKRATSGPREP